MDGKVVYGSLKDAVDSLNSDAQKLDDPIDTYMQNANQIGETGANAWGGTAAEQVVPVLTAIKSDIVQLQDACNEFSTNVNASLANYAEADVTNVNQVTDIKNV